MYFEGFNGAGDIENIFFRFNIQYLTIGSSSGVSLIEWLVSFKVSDDRKITLGANNDFSIGYDETLHDMFKIVSTNNIYSTPVYGIKKTNNRIAIENTAPSAKFHLTGVADEIQQIIQANSTQTANLVEYQNSAGTVQLALAGNGRDFILDTTTGTKLGTSTSQKLGFFNATPVVQPTEITDELTTITHTAPGTPDYALQDLVDSGAGSAFGFASKDEGNTVLSVIVNLQARVNELETVLSSLGLVADAD